MAIAPKNQAHSKKNHQYLPFNSFVKNSSPSAENTLVNAKVISNLPTTPPANSVRFLPKYGGAIPKIKVMATRWRQNIIDRGDTLLGRSGDDDFPSSLPLLF
jgi:hypothetical protein